MRGVSIAEAAIHFARDRTTGTLEEREKDIAHIAATTLELRQAVTYLAAQYVTAKRQTGADTVADARLAIQNIETAVREFRAREERREATK